MQGTAEEEMLHLHASKSSVASSSPQSCPAAVLEAGPSGPSPQRMPTPIPSDHTGAPGSAAPQRETGASLNSPAGSQQQRGRVSGAAAGRESGEAVRRGARNALLLSLHRVGVTELAEYQDLPMGPGQLTSNATVVQCLACFCGLRYVD